MSSPALQNRIIRHSCSCPTSNLLRMREPHYALDPSFHPSFGLSASSRSDGSVDGGNNVHNFALRLFAGHHSSMIHSRQNVVVHFGFRAPPFLHGPLLALTEALNVHGTVAVTVGDGVVQLVSIGRARRPLSVWFSDYVNTETFSGQRVRLIGSE